MCVNAKIHEEDCIRKLGAPFTYVHEWLDHDTCPEYKAPRHSWSGVAYIKSKWGENAGLAAEIHIRRDTGGYIPDDQSLRTWNSYPNKQLPSLHSLSPDI
jgi:hypothetical protein